jgi:hypothetical protein
MKRKIALIGAAAIAAAALTACGGGSHSAGNSTGMSSSSSSSSSSSGGTSSAQQLDTAQVLALAQKSSELDSAFEVNDGMLMLTDTSDTAEAISVNGM